MRPNVSRLIVADGLIGLSGAVIGLGVSWSLGDDVARALFSAALAALAGMIASSDLRRFIIPDGFVLALAAVGLLQVAVQPGALELLVEASLSCALCAGAFLTVRVVFHHWRGRHGLGLGDVKLAGAAGIWLDPVSFAQAVLLAAIAGLAILLVRSIRHARKPRRTMRVPFGACLAPALWVVWLP